jgi:hypothetical protein
MWTYFGFDLIVSNAILDVPLFSYLPLILSRLQGRRHEMKFLDKIIFPLVNKIKLMRGDAMLKRTLIVIVFLALAIPTWCEAKNIKTDDFQKQTGIKVTHPVDLLLPGYANVGQVVDVDKFKGHGFTEVSKGDFVTFDIRNDGSIKVILDPTGESKLIRIVEGK